MDQKNKKMFLVDDDFLIRDLYEKAFRLKGYNIETAIDGQDAVDKLEKMAKLPDLILLDIKMPKMTGYDVLRYLRHSDKFKNVGVVMLTSLSDEEVVDKTKELGALGFLVKVDYEPREIVAKVEEIIVSHQPKE